MLNLTALPVCSKDQQGHPVADEVGKTVESPNSVARKFSSDLPLNVFIIRVSGGKREQIGKTPSAHPLDIPRCASWGVCPISQVDMKALARQIELGTVTLHFFREEWDEFLEAVKAL